jgi:hypothetical protein
VGTALGGETETLPAGHDDTIEGRARADCLRAIDPIISETRRLVDRQSRAVERARQDLERAEKLELLVSALYRAIASDTSGHTGAVAHDAIKRALEARRLAKLRADKAKAEQGVNTIDLRPRAGGGLAVRVPGSRRIDLPLALARLLRVLIKAPSAPDGFPEWQSFDVVADAIAEKGQQRPSRRALAQLVYRTRTLFEHGQASRSLLQVDRQGRLRFLLRNMGRARQ